MGLDMYAYAIDKSDITGENPDAQTDICTNIIKPELAYWRKEYQLHDWMHDLYDSKGGVSKEFNCNTVVLTTKDLNKLLSDLRDKNITWHSHYPDNTQQYVRSVKAFVKSAKLVIKNGKIVIYYANW